MSEWRTQGADQAYAAALAALPLMGPSRLASVLRSTPTASAAWRLVLDGHAMSASSNDTPISGEMAKIDTVWRKHAESFDVQRNFKRYSDLGISVHMIGNASYPEKLTDDPEAPGVLFTCGTLGALNKPSVGVIGTRRCTHYGREVARELGRELSVAGVAVVSGLALGIDGEAHQGALAVENATPIAVVGSGLDVVYPKVNERLWNRVANNGLVLSEAPLGARPEAWRFPARNRIIAALCDVLVVVESHHRGGSRHTVEAATARSVPVMAVPGSIRSAASEGTNQLLVEGCAPVCCADDVLTAMNLNSLRLSPTRVGPAVRDAPAAPAVRDAPAVTDVPILDAVMWHPTPTEDVMRRTGLGLAPVAVALSRLAHQGWVHSNQGWWERI